MPIRLPRLSLRTSEPQPIGLPNPCLSDFRSQAYRFQTHAHPTVHAGLSAIAAASEPGNGNDNYNKEEDNNGDDNDDNDYNHESCSENNDDNYDNEDYNDNYTEYGKLLRF